MTITENNALTQTRNYFYENNRLNYEEISYSNILDTVGFLWFDQKVIQYRKNNVFYTLDTTVYIFNKLDLAEVYFLQSNTGYIFKQTFDSNSKNKFYFIRGQDSLSLPCDQKLH